MAGRCAASCTRSSGPRISIVTVRVCSSMRLRQSGLAATSRSAGNCLVAGRRAILTSTANGSRGTILRSAARLLRDHPGTEKLSILPSMGTLRIQMRSTPGWSAGANAVRDGRDRLNLVARAQRSLVAVAVRQEVQRPLFEADVPDDDRGQRVHIDVRAEVEVPSVQRSAETPLRSLQVFGVDAEFAGVVVGAEIADLDLGTHDPDSE